MVPAHRDEPRRRSYKAASRLAMSRSRAARSLSLISSNLIPIPTPEWAVRTSATTLVEIDSTFSNEESLVPHGKCFHQLDVAAAQADIGDRHGNAIGRSRLAYGNRASARVPRCGAALDDLKVAQPFEMDAPEILHQIQGPISILPASGVPACPAQTTQKRASATLIFHSEDLADRRLIDAVSEAR